jgi:DNA-directed RNA polymerase specialized sigma24 family protein
LRLLELREGDGFSLRAVAAMSEVSLSTVRDQIAAAHRRIGNALEPSRRTPAP